MEDNPDINENNNNISGQNIEMIDEINNFGDLDDEEEKNDDFIQDLIKQGKYFDVIKYLESKDNKTKNNKDNDLHEDNDNIINKSEEEEKKEDDKNKDNNESKHENQKEENNIITNINNNNENTQTQKNSENNIDIIKDNNIKAINSEQKIINDDKEEENISPKELIKNIINIENKKQKKLESSNNSSKSISLLHFFTSFIFRRRTRGK